MRPRKLSCYFVDCSGDGEGIAVVAYTAQAAKKIVWNRGECDGSWIEAKVQKFSDVDISGLPDGHVFGTQEGMQRGAYQTDCAVCGAVDCGKCSGKEDDE